MKKLILLIAIIALLTGCQTKNNMDDKVVCTSTRTMTIGDFKEYYELETNKSDDEKAISYKQEIVYYFNEDGVGIKSGTESISYENMTKDNLNLEKSLKNVIETCNKRNKREITTKDAFSKCEVIKTNKKIEIKVTYNMNYEERNVDFQNEMTKSKIIEMYKGSGTFCK